MLHNISASFAHKMKIDSLASPHLFLELHKVLVLAYILDNDMYGSQ